MTPGISQQSNFAPSQASSDWLTHTWRLTLWNVKLVRRRLMSKILLSILLAGFLLVMGILVLSYIVVSSYSSAAVANCPTPVATGQTGDNGSGNQTCDQSTIVQQRQSFQAAQNEELKLLTFPTILSPTGGYTGFMGSILLCILAGALIGSEYSFGTQRLALSRGLSRAQVLTGQVAMLALVALSLSAGMLLLGTLLGLSVGPALGGSLPALSIDGVLQLLGFWLVLALQLLGYSLIALLLGTLGRSTAAGIAGSLGYLLFEIIALPILTAIALVLIGTGSSFGEGLNHVQDVFLGPNISGLLSGVNASPLDLGGANASASANLPGADIISPLQGLFVVVVYCIALVGLSYWALRKRDVTN
jgi:ABC-type transport system involved in multi-copper enzyme maturation permease subunit